MGGISLDIVTMGMMAMVFLVRVVLVHLVPHLQMMRMMVDVMMMTMRSDHRFRMQLAAPLCFVDLLMPFYGDR